MDCTESYGIDFDSDSDFDPDKMNSKLNSAITMLVVEDVKRSAGFYRDKFGFEIEFIIEEGTPFACVSRDGHKLFFESYSGYSKDYKDFEKVAVKCGVYFMVEDVDLLYEEFKSRGVEFAWPPTSQNYGNRDMKIFDNSGYQVIFGTDVGNK